MHYQFYAHSLGILLQVELREHSECIHLPLLPCCMLLLSSKQCCIASRASGSPCRTRHNKAITLKVLQIESRNHSMRLATVLLPQI